MQASATVENVDRTEIAAKSDEDEAENVTDRSIQGYIAAGMTVRGRLSGVGDLEIDGLFDGEMELEGNVTILEAGQIKGPISATSVAVDGRVRGSVNGNRIAVHEGGRIDGDLRANELGIDDGAVVRGTIDMDFDKPVPSAELPTTRSGERTKRV